MTTIAKNLRASTYGCMHAVYYLVLPCIIAVILYAIRNMVAVDLKLLIHLGLLLLHYLLGTTGSSYIECKSQQEACVCEDDQRECHFRLKIEEVQTFTSYRYRDNDELLIRGFAGSTYYLDSTGVHPSLPPPFQFSYGPCWSDNITSLDDFREINCSVPMMVDGHTYHSAITVNDRMPGPTLIVTEGQKVVIDVHNRLASEGVTIHWHGLHQRGTPWMDGVGFLSQAPITPGSMFRYTFTANPAGTHWYHSHVGTQRVDGCFGAFIVREKSDTTEEAKREIGEFEDTPEQHTITLLDFLREDSVGAYVKVKSVLPFYSEKQLEGVPQETDRLTPSMHTTDGSNLGPMPYWSGLINGKGRYDLTTYSLLSIFTVDVRKAYRFRVIGAQALYSYKLEVVGHKLNIMASDGNLLIPTEVDYLIVHAGERYDFILTADKNPGNYLIRAQVLGIVNLSSDPNQFVNLTAEAILHYNDISVPQPNPLTHYDNVIDDVRECRPTKRCKAINCPLKNFPSEMNIDCISLNQLQSLIPSKEEDLPNLRTLLYNCSTLFLNFGFDGNIADPSVNGRTFQLPPSPYQTYPGQYEEDRRLYPSQTCRYCQVVNKSSQNCDCTHVIPIAQDKLYNIDSGSESGHIIMVFSAVTLDLGQESHPIHLHGHNFHVVHVEHGTYDSNGLLQSSSTHIDCDTRCQNPTWNGTIPDFSKYMSDGGKLIETAIRKDTILVPAGGYVVVAVPLNNPGYWLLHCHSEPHLFKGMAVVLQEYPENQHPKPPYGINKVGHFIGGEDQQAPESNQWKTGAIAALILVAIALVVIIVQGIVIARTKSSVLCRCSGLHKHVKDSMIEYSVFNEETENSSEEVDDNMDLVHS